MFQNPNLERARINYQAKLETVDEQTRAKLAKSMETSFEDLAAYQNLQSQAFAMGTIPQDLAQDLYMAIGPSCTNYAKLDLASQLTVTTVMGELLKRKMG